MNVDVVVVGAGPGGSTAAREIAVRGASVVLLDRARFPRDKPCGGAVSMRCAELLPFDLSPIVEHVVTGAQLRLRSGASVARDFDGVLTYMTRRSRFDHFLVERAREAGVDFRDGRTVDRVERLYDGGYHITAGGETYSVRALVGADGANGVVATALGFERPPDGAIAIEANIAYRHGDGAPQWLDGRVALQLGSMPGGYGWVFPKGDHMNVGVGGWTAVTGKQLRGALRELCRAYDLDPEAMFGMRGHHLPMSRAGAPVTSGAAALVGDAAGLVDPLSGEGIYAAVASGVALAPAVEDFLAGRTGSLAGYQRTVERELEPDLAASRALMEILHAWPWPWVRLMQRSGGFWRRFGGVLRGEDTLDRIVHGYGPLVFTLQPAARLARLITTRRWGER